MNAFIRLLYAVLVAASVVTFLGVSIFTFYQPPKAPIYPEYNTSQTDAQRNKQSDNYQKSYKNFQENQQKPYQRNVSIVLVGASVIASAVGIYLLKRFEVLGEGLMLGGVGTVIYAIIAANIASNRPLRFIGVLLLLASVIMLVQKRFTADKKPD